MPPSDHYHDQHGGDFFPPPSRPRAARGGIKLRATTLDDSRRTWWSKRWLAPIEATATPDRARRGLAYARGGQVLEMQVSLGSITAAVQGTRRVPYEVSITLKQLTQTVWVTLAESLGARAEYRADLLAGLMPEAVEAVFARAGLSLYPTTEDADTEMTCTCADWAMPCRHVLAAAYLAGELLDSDPLAAFTLRGIEPALLLTLIAGAGAEGSGRSLAAAQSRGDRASDGDDDASLSDAIDHDAFWHGHEATLGADIDPPAVDAPLLQILGPIPLWRGEAPFEESMQRIYRRIGTDPRALNLALGTSVEGS